MTVFTNYAFNTTTGNTPRTEPVRWSDIINIKEFGAVGDGTTDCTAAINAAIAAALLLFSWSKNQNTNIHDTLGARAALYIPAGTYVVSSSLTTLDVPIAIKGDGSFVSILLISTALSGDVISYSECWGAFQSTGNPSQSTRTGPHIEGLTILGQQSANIQNAVTFYDRNDMIYMRDVSVMKMNGRGLSVGVVQTVTQAYARESHFHDLRFFNCGTAALPVIEIGTVGGGDRTNTCYWSGIDIFSAVGDGLVLRSTATNGLAADTQFFDYVRIENPGGSGMKLGDTAFTGRVNNCCFSKVLMFTIPTGHFGIELHNGGNINKNYQNRILLCQIGASNGGGINVAGARDFYFQGDIGTTQTGITVGATSGASDLTGSNLIFDLFRNDSLSTNIDASATGNVFHPTLSSGV
jgi:hypothetical protein